MNEENKEKDDLYINESAPDDEFDFVDAFVAGLFCWVFFVWRCSARKGQSGPFFVQRLCFFDSAAPARACRAIFHWAANLRAHACFRKYDFNSCFGTAIL